MDPMPAYGRPNGLVNVSQVNSRLGKQPAVIVLPLRASLFCRTRNKNVVLGQHQEPSRGIETSSQARGRVDSRWTEATPILKPLSAAHTVPSFKGVGTL